MRNAGDHSDVHTHCRGFACTTSLLALANQIAVSPQQLLAHLRRKHHPEELDPYGSALCVSETLNRATLEYIMNLEFLITFNTTTPVNCDLDYQKTMTLSLLCR